MNGLTWASGKTIRLNALMNSMGFYFFVAADHRLSNGNVDGLLDLESIVSLVNDHDALTAVVLNIGACARLPSNFRKVPIPQLMGSSVRSNKSLRKVSVATVSDAVRLGATLVSLQLNFEEESSTDQLATFSAMRSEAAALGIPVLAMINLRDTAAFAFPDFADYIAQATELGADILKINLPIDATHKIEAIRRVLSHSPPALLSGDEMSSRYLSSVRLSSRCGFSGLCVGRNIFENQNPRGVVDESCTTFTTES